MILSVLATHAKNDNCNISSFLHPNLFVFRLFNTNLTQKEGFSKHQEKREIADNQCFLLIRHYFLRFQTQIYVFELYLLVFYRLQVL